MKVKNSGEIAMRSEKRDIVEPRKATVYIAEDGKEFDNKYSCKDYEAELEAIKRNIPRVRAIDVDDDYNNGTMWYLSNKEEFDWLVSEYCYDGVIVGNGRKFCGPGWYLVYWVEQFDIPDEWHIVCVETKIKNYEKKINNLRKLQAGEVKTINEKTPTEDRRFYRRK